MNKSILTILVVLLSISCNSLEQKNNKGIIKQGVKSEPWKLENYIDSVQILLTNEYKLNNSFGYGASSFLIKSDLDTYLCTAKHLLGEAMGINPEIKTSRFNSSLEYWNAYPRSGKIANDTISVTKLINIKQKGLYSRVERDHRI
jgi:predicted chitinase